MCECWVATSKKSRCSSELSMVLDYVHWTMGSMGVDVEDADALGHEGERGCAATSMSLSSAS